MRPMVDLTRKASRPSLRIHSASPSERRYEAHSVNLLEVRQLLCALGVEGKERGSGSYAEKELPLRLKSMIRGFKAAKVAEGKIYIEAYGRDGSLYTHSCEVPRGW